jgi:hypothetical protein
VETRTPQVGINDQTSPIGLANNGLRQVVGYKRLAFCRYRTGNQESAKLLASAQLIKSGSQGAKLFRRIGAKSGIRENVYIGIWMPVRMCALLAQVFEPS